MDNQCILLTWCLETGVDLDENSSCRLDGVEGRGEEVAARTSSLLGEGWAVYSEIHHLAICVHNTTRHDIK